MKKNNRMKKQFNLIELFIQYCKSNFLIPISSNYKFFSFEKENKFTYKKSSESYYDFIWACRAIKEYSKGEMIDEIKEDYKKKAFNLLSQMKVEKIILLDDSKLLLQFCHYMNVGIYTFDIKNHVFSFNYLILTDRAPKQIVKIENSSLILISAYRKAERLVIKDKTYEKYNLTFYKCLFCIELNNQRLLMLTTTGLLYINLKQSKEYPFDIERYAKYTFGFKLSNNLILINKENIVLIESLEYFDRKKNFASFSNEIFKAIKCCTENIQKQILYCQTGNYITIISTKTFQIQSIYKTFHFLFYPLSYSKNDLISTFFQNVNYSTTKISNLLLLKGYKDIFQISDYILLVSSDKHFYVFTIN